jgi:hypothetical protein
MVFLSFKGGRKKNPKKSFRKRKNLGFLDDDGKLRSSCFINFEKSAACHFNADLWCVSDLEGKGERKWGRAGSYFSPYWLEIDWWGQCLLCCCGKIYPYPMMKLLNVPEQNMNMIIRPIAIRPVRLDV